MISRLRCRHCGWDNDIPHLRIPRYGARIRCPECGGVQTLLPAQSDDSLRPPEVMMRSGTDQPPSEVSLPEPETSAPPIVDHEDAVAMRLEARQLLDLWFKELQRDHVRTITASHLFTDHSDELAHLYGLWQTSFPGERATELFREELIASLGDGAGELQPALVDLAEGDG